MYLDYLLVLLHCRQTLSSTPGPVQVVPGNGDMVPDQAREKSHNKSEKHMAAMPTHQHCSLPFKRTTSDQLVPGAGDTDNESMFDNELSAIRRGAGRNIGMTNYLVPPMHISHSRSRRPSPGPSPFTLPPSTPAPSTSLHQDAQPLTPAEILAHRHLLTQRT